MTIRLHHVGLEKVQVLPKDVAWVGSLPNNNAELNGVGSLKLQYTSLRDLMVVSSTKKGSFPTMKEPEWYDPSQVKFKDKLLKQAARAYLQPTGRKTAPKVHFFERCCKRFFARNKSFVELAKEYVWDRMRICANFLRVHVMEIVEHFKLYYLPSILRLRRHQLA